MTRIEYTECDDCGKHLTHAAPFTVEREEPRTLSDPLPEVIHACSTACLVRLVNQLHRTAV